MGWNTLYMTPLTGKIVMGLVFTLLLQFPIENTNFHEEKVDRVEKKSINQTKKDERICQEMKFHIDGSYFFFNHALINGRSCPPLLDLCF